MVDNTIIRCYNIYPTGKNSIYTIEQWCNTLSTGKHVTVLYTQNWRNGTFTVEMNDEDKAKIEVQESVITMNDIGASIEKLENGWDYETTIENIDNYNDAEKTEIHRLMYCDEDDDEYDCETDYSFDSNIMDTNGWDMQYTIYEMYDGCELEQTSE